jgi:hypothetical protein
MPAPPEKSGITSVYDRHGYSEENRRIMEAVAQKIMIYSDSPRIRRSPLPNGAIRILPNG